MWSYPKKEGICGMKDLLIFLLNPPFCYFFCLFLLVDFRCAERGSSYGIPLLLLHVTIEGRPHSSARELRGDGLKITPKDGMKEIVEQPKQKEGQDFFQDSQNLYTTS